MSSHTHKVLNSQRDALNIFFFLHYCFLTRSTGGKKANEPKQWTNNKLFHIPLGTARVCVAFAILSMNANNITESNIMARALHAE